MNLKKAPTEGSFPIIITRFSKKSTTGPELPAEAPELNLASEALSEKNVRNTETTENVRSSHPHSNACTEIPLSPENRPNASKAISAPWKNR